LRKSHVLVVDDEELYRRSLARILTRVGHEITEARDGSEAIAVASAQHVDLVLADIRMPGINGLELVRQLHEIHPDLPCIVMTGFGGPEQSIEALRAGAFWYLEKPFDQGQLDAVRKLVEQAIEHGRLKTENRQLQRELRSRYRFENVIGTSPALRSVLELVSKVADTDSTVLITGESGTGKELIARAIHYNSRRAERRMVTVNCGAIPGELLEAELFGHMRGAFTGAESNKKGLLEVAEKGTIFLDEIGEMSAVMQVKFLRVLQERRFRRVGGLEELQADIRVIAATNQDLSKAVAEGRFREDLFYRINVIPIALPPLRERREDIPLLANHFLAKYTEQMGKSITGIARPALELLQQYDWPGNIRELENVMERAVALERTPTILPDSLPQSTRNGGPKPAPAAAETLPETGFDLEAHVKEIERGYIAQALEQAGGVQVKAAELVGMSFRSFRYYVKKYNLR
jgi:two-component system response regulator PilR (NtrC family)